MGKRRRQQKATVKPLPKAPPFTPELQDRLAQWIEEAAVAFDLEVYDAQFQQQGQWIIRVFVEPVGEYDTGAGVSLDQCTGVSRYVEALMDVDGSIPEHYTIEVSSPGIERILRTSAHYQKMLNSPIQLKVRKSIQGQYRIQGVLVAFADNKITLKVDQPEELCVDIELSNIKRANVMFDFNK